MPGTSIADLLAVPPEDQDQEWLQTSLQAAIELEFATIPIYLSGMWSLQQQSGPVYDLINSVVLEEMLHLGLACNMLVAVGGKPQITAPTYPHQGLPGGVLPDLEVYLAGLGDSTLQMWMGIEQPEDPVVADTAGPTIGQFYDTIYTAFGSYSQPLVTDGQVTFSVFVPGLKPEAAQPIGTVQAAQSAIELIKEQGEGTSASPDAPQQFGDEYAHFYRFGEILYGQQLEQVDGKWEYAGPAITRPPCYPVMQVPLGGYPAEQYPAVADAIPKFDAAYLKLIGQLQAAWSPGGSLGAAIATMGTLHGLAAPIVTTPLPDGSGNFGPDFVPANATSQTE